MQEARSVKIEEEVASVEKAAEMIGKAIDALVELRSSASAILSVWRAGRHSTRRIPPGNVPDGS
jgi:Xaa-Pro aminopeptidase